MPIVCAAVAIDSASLAAERGRAASQDGSHPGERRGERRLREDLRREQAPTGR